MTIKDELQDDETQRGPEMATRKVYTKGQPQRFMEEIIATGKFRTVVNEETGLGVFVGQITPKARTSETGRDVAFVLFEVFRGDVSLCCNSTTRRKRKTGEHKCTKCGEMCETKQEWIRRPTYIPNPRTGQRIAYWNQCIVQWDKIDGVIAAMAELHGAAIPDKLHEDTLKEEVKVERELDDLKGWGL